MPTLGAGELVLILAVVLLLFGAKKLPGLAHSMGKSIKEFRKATTEANEDTVTSQGRTETDSPTEAAS